MAVVTDLEDVNSMCLTVVSKLLERHHVCKSRIGRLEVGTESIQDKSKSVKSYLMQLFEHTDICGVDNINACYGGTAALLNCVAWMESADWDGRLAVVVAGDVAVYGKGTARPTGGAGAVALLVGPNAPLVFERGTTAHYMRHVFDFYKPNPALEYPMVDGPLSVKCYLQALDATYSLHLDKLTEKKKVESPNIDSFDYLVFHSPYGKLVQKAFGRILFNDAMRLPADHSDIRDFLDMNLDDTYLNRELDFILQQKSKNFYEAKTLSSRLLLQQVGNCYSASLYMGLVSLLAQLGADQHENSSLVGKRIGMFSYGSGLAATMFSIKIAGDPKGITTSLEELKTVLSKRIQITCKEFDKLCERREQLYCQCNWQPCTIPSTLRPGTFYLERIDEKYRRFYSKT